MKLRKPVWKRLPGIKTITQIAESLQGVVLSLEYEFVNGTYHAYVRTTNGSYIFDYEKSQWAKFDTQSETFKVPLESVGPDGEIYGYRD